MCETLIRYSHWKENMGYPGWPQACPHSGIPVVHQCRVETSVHHSSSDQRCKDYQGSFQIICGAMHEQNFQSPANCQKSSRAQTCAHEWLRLDAKRIEALSPLASQGHSRFSLRDIGTLFPIWPTGHRHTIPDLAYGTSAASRVGARWRLMRTRPSISTVSNGVYQVISETYSIAHQGCKVNQATQDDPRPALAVIQKVSVQRRRHGNWVLWLIYLL